MTEQREYIITEEQLRYIRDDCVYPNGAGCDGCEFANTDEMDCAFDSDKVMDDVRSRPYTNEREKVHTKQCVNCIRRGLRECMYHGYPEETIPLSCAYKIGDAAVNTVYDVPVATRKRGEQK